MYGDTPEKYLRLHLRADLRGCVDVKVVIVVIVGAGTKRASRVLRHVCSKEIQLDCVSGEVLECVSKIESGEAMSDAAVMVNECMYIYMYAIYDALAEQRQAPQLQACLFTLTDWSSTVHSHSQIGQAPYKACYGLSQITKEQLQQRFQAIDGTTEHKVLISSSTIRSTTVRDMRTRCCRIGFCIALMVPLICGSTTTAAIVIVMVAVTSALSFTCFVSWWAV